MKLVLYSPSGVVARAAPLARAARRLGALGYAVEIDEAAMRKHQRFAGDDETRLAALHRVAAAAPEVALASRGGYGLSRLLDRIDWGLVAQSVERGTRWVGHSDLTLLQLGLLAHASGDAAQSWAGPLACDDFGRTEDEGGVDDVTQACFVEAIGGELEAIGFRETSDPRGAPRFDGLEVAGTLWGGNLCLVASLLGTRHWPARRATKGGVLFLEDVNEHPYRVERSLLQLHQAGVLAEQKAVLLGSFDGWRTSPLDRGYRLRSAIDHLRACSATPMLAGLPFGHVRTKVMLPVGRRVRLVVDGRNALLGWRGEP